MQILKIRLEEHEQTKLFVELIKRFNTEDNKQTIEGNLNDQIEWESTLELYTEGSEPDENNQSEIISRSVMKFRITFFHDGEEVECTNADAIHEAITKNYEI